MKTLTALVFLSVFFFPRGTWSLHIPGVIISVPPQCDVTSSANVTIGPNRESRVKISFNKNTVFPFELTITDLFGAHIHKLVLDPRQLENWQVPQGLIKTKYANPATLDKIPELCPRARLLYNDKDEKKSLVYDVTNDVLNQSPVLQAFDPDFADTPSQKRLLKNFDTKNLLTLTHARISYDHEDSTILDYRGPNPLNAFVGRPQLIYEGEGGFYANIHFAVVPYDARYLKLARQEILNLAQGKLATIDRLDLKPELRTHSFLPGPYLSKNDVYAMCEWGDTHFQASVQEMTYNNLKIWDWDLKDERGKKIDKVLVIIWEGDEEDWLIADGLLDPYYLTDDLIGIFTVKRVDTKRAITFKNKAGNFEMTLETK